MRMLAVIADRIRYGLVIALALSLSFPVGCFANSDTCDYCYTSEEHGAVIKMWKEHKTLQGVYEKYTNDVQFYKNEVELKIKDLAERDRLLAIILNSQVSNSILKKPSIKFDDGNFEINDKLVIRQVILDPVNGNFVVDRTTKIDLNIEVDYKAYKPGHFKKNAFKYGVVIGVILTALAVYGAGQL